MPVFPCCPQPQRVFLRFSYACVAVCATDLFDLTTAACTKLSALHNTHTHTLTLTHLHTCAFICTHSPVVVVAVALSSHKVIKNIKNRIKPVCAQSLRRGWRFNVCSRVVSSANRRERACVVCRIRSSTPCDCMRTRRRHTTTTADVAFTLQTFAILRGKHYRTRYTRSRVRSAGVNTLANIIRQRRRVQCNCHTRTHTRTHTSYSSAAHPSSILRRTRDR